MMYKYKVKVVVILKGGGYTNKEVIISHTEKLSKSKGSDQEIIYNKAANELGLDRSFIKPSSSGYWFEEISQENSSSNSNWKEERKEATRKWNEDLDKADRELDNLIREREQEQKRLEEEKKREEERKKKQEEKRFNEELLQNIAIHEKKKRLESIPVANEGQIKLTKEWMKSNLDVGTFKDGTQIPQAKSSTEWLEYSSKRIGCWCYANYDEKLSYYGKLYNHYAVRDERGLAPEGFFIPSSDDFNELIKDLGGVSIGGNNEKVCGRVKSTSGWEEVNYDGISSGNGNNASGLDLKPNPLCYRGSFLSDSLDGSKAYLWTSSKNYRFEKIKSFGIFSKDIQIERGAGIIFTNDHKTEFIIEDADMGMCVRCCKEKTQTENETRYVTSPSGAIIDTETNTHAPHCKCGEC